MEDIKCLEENYQKETENFKKAMEASLHMLTQQKTRQDELQKTNLELVAKLEKTKNSKQSKACIY